MDDDTEEDIIIKIPTEKGLELMIIEEEKIRTSKEYQNLCTKVKNIPNGWLDVTEQIQINLVKKYGFIDSISCDVACNHLRRAQYMYPNNPIFKQVPTYVRENKANIGTLDVGSIVPNITLHSHDLSTIKLHDLILEGKLNIIFASSET